ncbi:hypothetical protein [Amycolatopsis sp. NPDC004169]|uniref:hypothetical protein n=1 Tax=Amycolatopsis sp. NPDC004169 TaxID=3154453 RepID=UPI0033B58878
MTKPPERIVNSASVGDGNTGDLVQVGIVAGDFHYGATGAAKSWYLGKVRELAPDTLVGRETELAELKRFCLAADPASPYAWWRADAWSGKTALMASFALDPPEGVRLVPFFVRAPDAEADGRAGFLTEVDLQLAEVLGIPLPENAGASGFPGLLDAAAEVTERLGHRLILIVDGLDEDRGAGENDGAGSIAALLPRRPTHGMRVIVTGRPNPGIPPALHPDHPLRDPAIVRELVSSSAASAAELEMKGDLDRLLDGEAEARDVLGLLVAARGGLSRDDLVELVGRQADSVHRILDSVEGRAFSRRRARWNFGPEVYVLAHEGLQARAVGRFGSDGLQAYRDRLMAWADEYRDRGWPASTPQFLLLGYPRLLQETGQLQRLVECVTDLARQERLQDVSGGEAAAQAEIAAAHAEVSASAQPDVVGLLKLSMHRDDLEARNARTPARLPALWARLGQFARAEALARSISEPKRRADAVYELVPVMVRAGRADRADRIVTEAVDEAEFPIVRQYLLTEIAAAGDLPRAMAMAEAIGDASWRRRALLTLAAPRPLTDPATMLAAADKIPDDKARINTRHFVARRLIEQGDVARAVAVAEDLDLSSSVDVITRAARRLRDDGDPEAAADLAASAAAPGIVFSMELEDLARTDLERAKEKVLGLGDSNRRGDYVCDLVELAIEQGSVGFAESLLDLISPVHGRRALFPVLESLAAHDDKRAMELLAIKSDEWSGYVGTEVRAAAMTAIAEGLLKAGDTAKAETLASEAESAARSLSDEHGYKPSFRRVADFVVAARDVPAAERFARVVLASGARRHGFSGIAELLAESGDMELAERVGLRLVGTSAMFEVMIPLVRRHRAAGAAKEVCRIVRGVGDRVAEQSLMESELPRLVALHCAAGFPDQGLEIARKIEKSYHRDSAYKVVIREFCAEGRIESAAEIVRGGPVNELAPSLLAVALAEAMGAVGYGDGLEVLDNLEVKHRSAAVKAFLERLAECDLERALHLASTSLSPFERSSALVAMADRLAEPARSRLLAQVAQSNEWPSVLPALRPGECPGVTEVVDQFLTLQESRVGLDPGNG